MKLLFGGEGYTFNILHFRLKSNTIMSTFQEELRFFMHLEHICIEANVEEKHFMCVVWFPR
jgi:hypothetical protein